MKLKAIGICNEDKHTIPCIKAADFSSNNYDGIQLRKAKGGMPVVIMRSRKTAPLMWKVAYGYSQVFFRTFAEAVKFCNSHSMKIVKKQMKT